MEINELGSCVFGNFVVRDLPCDFVSCFCAMSYFDLSVCLYEGLEQNWLKIYNEIPLK